LKFLTFLGCHQIKNAQALKDLGAVFRNCKHLKTIEFERCRIGICELLDEIPNSSTCSLKIRCTPFLYMTTISRWRDYSLSSVEAEKLAGVLPRFNVTALHLVLVDCCAAAVNKLVSSITHKTLQELVLYGISLTPAAAVTLGRSLPELSSLEMFGLIGVDGSTLQVKEVEALFGGINKTYPTLKWLLLKNFDARGSLAPLTRRVFFFSNLTCLELGNLNMDKREMHGLLESITFISNLKGLFLYDNPLGSPVRVQSAVQQALPQAYLGYRY